MKLQGIPTSVVGGICTVVQMVLEVPLKPVRVEPEETWTNSLFQTLEAVDETDSWSLVF